MNFTDLEENKKQFRILLSGMMEMPESIKGTKIEGDYLKLQDAESIYKKTINHCISIYHLIGESEVPEFGIRILDYSSIRILTRAVHEAVLVFYYLFIDPTTIDEENFRYYIYSLNEAVKLLDMPFETIDKEMKKAWRDDKKDVIDKCTKTLKANSLYKELKEKSKKKLLDGKRNWRPSWAEMGEKAGLRELHAKWNYSLLCGDAHSSSFSLLQVRGIQSLVDRHFSVVADLQVLMILMTKQIKFYSRVFNPATKFLESKENKELRNVMEIWDYIGSEEIAKPVRD
ncbi:MAG TPA: hypothetical protein ENO22_00305 [candidate division Zixibacteria bacterium]|nr:hypothetical protein [candidate division Zixibacteria bacterium]